MKASRDDATVNAAIEAIYQCAKSGEGNLLELSINAAKARATVGEISDAMEKVYGRYVPKYQIVRGAYSKQSTKTEKGTNDFDEAHQTVKDFSKKEGRNPRILIAKIGQDGHDRGAKVIASGFADLGFDVDIGALFSTPDEVARQAIDNDVHIVGVSSLAAGHNTLVPLLKTKLVSLIYLSRCRKNLVERTSK
jgi:methylmalonyl-CoA mutase